MPALLNTAYNLHAYVDVHEAHVDFDSVRDALEHFSQLQALPGSFSTGIHHSNPHLWRSSKCIWARGIQGCIVAGFVHGMSRKGDSVVRIDGWEIGENAVCGRKMDHVAVRDRCLPGRALVLGSLPDLLTHLGVSIAHKRRDLFIDVGLNHIRVQVTMAIVHACNAQIILSYKYCGLPERRLNSLSEVNYRLPNYGLPPLVRFLEGRHDGSGPIFHQRDRLLLRCGRLGRVGGAGDVSKGCSLVIALRRLLHHMRLHHSLLLQSLLQRFC